MNSLSFVSRIKDLPLTDFIACCIDNDLTSIVKQGTPTDEQLYSAWLALLSQYYEERQDLKAAEQWGLVGQMTMLELRKQVIEMLCLSLEGLYMTDTVTRLQAFGYQDMTFSPDTLAHDLMCVRNNEKNNDLEYTALKEQLDAITANTRDKAGQPVKQTERTFYGYVMSYNEAFKTAYTVGGLNTLEYAYLCKRLDEHIEFLNNQNNTIDHAG